MATAVFPRAGLQPGLSTPNALKVFRALLIALDLTLLVAILIGTHVHRAAMQTVGKDAAPSIIAAQHIKAALADMDADAANEMLSAAQAGGDQAYELRRTEASRALVDAAQNITYGESERRPIELLATGMGTYEDAVQQARDLHAANNPGAVAAYRQAASVMEQTLLPAADALDQANTSVLERTYTEQSGLSAFARLCIVLAGAVTLAVLVGVQMFLFRRMQRVLNPGLLIASVLTVGLTVFSVSHLSGEQRSLRLAKEDGFTSIHALWRARALAYEANSEESRYLTDPARATQYQQAFFTESDALARLPLTSSVEQDLATLARGERLPGFSGYLADELNNITFPGEREAAVRTLAAFEQYLQIDATLRRLEASGKHSEAVALCIGTGAGQSDWAFARFDDALGATLAINQAAFQAAVNGGFDVLTHQEIAAGVLAVLIAVLVVQGLAARLREYL